MSSPYLETAVPSVSQAWVDSFVEKAWKFLGSVNLMIGIVSLLALTALIGTLIIQEPQASKPLTEIYSPQTLHLLKAFGLIDLYHSLWFVMLLGAFSINLICGTIQIWPRNMKVMRQEPRPLNLKDMEEFQYRFSFDTSVQDLSLLKKIFLEKMSDRFYKSQVLLENKNGFQVFVQKGRYSKCLVFFIHTALLIIVVGAFLGSFLGFEGNVNIAIGETVNYYFEGPQLVRRALPFGIRCDDFHVEYYPGTDRPKTYMSDLKIIQNGVIVSEKKIEVNDPLKFNGIHMYQASYGSVEPAKFTLRVVDQKTKKESRFQASVMQPVHIKEKNIMLNILQYAPQFDQFGPALKLGIKEQNGAPFSAMVLKNYPKFDAFHRKGRYTYILENINEKYYTGLQLGSNPGFPVILSGCAMLILGLFLSAFWSFRKFWVHVEEGKVTIVGKSTKYPLTFERQMQKLVSSLRAVSV